MADKTVKVGSTVSFKDNSISDTVATYIWDFGVGEGTSDLKDPSHTYNTIGLYTVTHSITNSCGTVNCTPKTIEVTAQGPSGGGSSAIALLGAAALGFMMLVKK